MSAIDRDPQVADLLAGTELFKGLTGADLANCASRFHRVRFAKGEALFARGAAGESLYVIAEGQVRLSVANNEGRELSFQVAHAGDVVGEIAVLDGRPRSAEAVALTAVTTYAIDRRSFRELWSAHPNISAAVISFLCWRIRDASDRLEAIALDPMEVRLAKFLLLALNGRKAPPGRRVPLELGFNQSELAQLLGASRSKINVAMGDLESAGVIHRTADRLFCDPDKLAQIADRRLPDRAAQ